jgi:uncharacterized membrane protein YcaP (DUF421 family)
MFDYVNGITIGSIAAEMATSLDKNFTQPLIAMVVYAAAAVFLSWVSGKSMKARRLIEGSPLILMDHGELYRENLKKAKIDVAEFLVQCRGSGYFDISQLESAILEGNGKISFLPKTSDRPVTPSDLNLHPKEDRPVANVIMDGILMKENLRHTGREEEWLLRQIRGQGANQVEDVFLATCDMEGTVTVFLKNNQTETRNILM